MNAPSRTATLIRLTTRPGARRRLICLPYAGGGVAPFRAWGRSLPDDVELVAAQLPGREARLREPLLDSIAHMVDAVLAEIDAHSDLPYALFGHSMGAVVAYELTLALEQRGVRPPSRLFVSGRRPPDEPDSRPPLHALPEPEFIVELQRRYGAIPAPVLAEPELLSLLLPIVRADIRAVETYMPAPDVAAIACPVTVYGGDQDLHPTPEQLPLWNRATSEPVTVRVFSGEHFYLNVQRDALTSDIAARWRDGVDAVEWV